MSYEVKGLDTAQIAYDNRTPGDESPLYRCDTCDTEIYEGDKENLIERLKKMLVENMLQIKKKKIDRPRAKLSLKNNAEQAHFTDEKAFLKWAEEQDKAEFINISIKHTLSKAAVKAALQNGEELPGAWLEKSVSVIIK